MSITHSDLDNLYRENQWVGQDLYTLIHSYHLNLVHRQLLDFTELFKHRIKYIGLDKPNFYQNHFTQLFRQISKKTIINYHDLYYEIVRIVNIFNPDLHKYDIMKICQLLHIMNTKNYHSLILTNKRQQLINLLISRFHEVKSDPRSYFININYAKLGIFDIILENNMKKVNELMAWKTKMEQEQEQGKWF